MRAVGIYVSYDDWETKRFCCLVDCTSGRTEFQIVSTFADPCLTVFDA